MKIVIVGDGKVGATLTEHLSKEGHDVVVIDQNPKVVEEMVNQYDVMGISGNGASYGVLMEAGANKANLLIAATSSDELNILSCMVSKKIGARHTIARVRNPEYSQQLVFLREELGLSMVVNPEMETATEICRLLRFPSAINIETFARGRVELAEIKVNPGSALDHQPLYNLPDRLRVKILICAVQRDGKVIIPDGNFILQAGDKIHVTASHAELATFFKILGIYKQRARNVMIVGGGKIAHYLAFQLLDAGMQVKIIELDRQRCHALSEWLPKATIIHGDGTDQELLLQEGIEQMDAVVSLTGMDEENILISMYAQSLKRDKVVTKINRLAFLDMLGNMGLDTIVSPKTIAANRIIRYVRAMHNSTGSSVQTLYKLVGGQVEALEFIVAENAKFVGIPLKDLKTKPNILLACIIRNNKVIIPRGNDTMEPRDSVIVVTNSQYLRDLSDILESERGFPLS